MIKVSILGSTGSIGTQCLDVVRENRDRFAISSLVAKDNWELLIKQAIEFLPKYVVIANELYYHKVKDALSHLDIEVMTGEDAILDVVSVQDLDIVLTAMVGFSGLAPTIKAIKAGKDIALSNKETMVVAGELINELKNNYGNKIIPVDSEHSAIYQCLIGETQKAEKIILTASGGPFREFSKEQLKTVTKTQALKHPNWSMGAKVTIDSASLMNKGLEMIEAKWLFDMAPKDIEVLVHPQSIIHSMVYFQDASYKAQLGIADMRLPISYAIGYTDRIKNNYDRLDFAKIGALTFENPDTDRFPNLALAYKSIEIGESAPTVLNASNEIAVEAFLSEKISFIDISNIVETQLNSFNHYKLNNLDDYIAVDKEIRIKTKELIDKK